MIDYAVASRSWDRNIPAGTALPDETVVAECTAIGFTAKGHEEWNPVGDVRVECLGVPAYPNQTYPRVIGVIRPVKQLPVNTADITYILGDAGNPRGSGQRIVAQVVNDSAYTWGGGFSRVARERWPSAQKAFREWAEQDRSNLRLGKVHIADVDENFAVVSMVAQHGFGPSPKPRIRYMALRTCLEQLGTVAAERNASVHMPKIGSGQAGGSWSIVRELVQEAVCARRIKVFVYELPWGAVPSPAQASLEFS
jgi:O-acetyl-ADP-ribose deacetylase (regulator of RNase III)